MRTMAATVLRPASVSLERVEGTPETFRGLSLEINLKICPLNNRLVGKNICNNYYNYFSYQPYRKIIINNKVRSWNDFHLTEISEEDFKYAFNKALKEEQNIFSSFIDE